MQDNALDIMQPKDSAAGAAGNHEHAALINRVADEMLTANPNSAAKSPGERSCSLWYRCG